MKYVLCLCVFTVTSFEWATDLWQGNTYTRTNLVMWKGSCSSPLHAQESRLHVTLPNGKETQADLLVFYDPESHLYAWKFYRTIPNQEDHALDRFVKYGAIGIRNGRLVQFEVGSWLEVCEGDRQASNLDDATQKALAAATGQISELAGDGASQVKLVSPKDVPRDFYHPSSWTRPLPDLPPVKVMQAVYVNGQWELLLRCQWKAKVVLNDLYEWISTERVPDEDPTK